MQGIRWYHGGKAWGRCGALRGAPEQRRSRLLAPRLDKQPERCTVRRRPEPCKKKTPQPPSRYLFCAVLPRHVQITHDVARGRAERKPGTSCFRLPSVGGRPFTVTRRWLLNLSIQSPRSPPVCRERPMCRSEGITSCLCLLRLRRHLGTI